MNRYVKSLVACTAVLFMAGAVMADPVSDAADRARFDAASGSPGASAQTALDTFQAYLIQYRRYLVAPSGSAEESDAKQQYNQLKARYQQQRASGMALFATPMEALQAYLNAYEQYLKDPSGSTNETLGKLEYPEYKAEFDRLRATLNLFGSLSEGFEIYVSQYAAYLRAPSGSTEETLLKMVYPLYQTEYQTRVGRGEHMFTDVNAARAAYKAANETYMAAPSGSSAETIAKLRRTEYDRELRSLGGQP